MKREQDIYKTTTNIATDELIVSEEKQAELAEMNGFVEWTATLAPVSDFPMTTDMEIIDVRKWWQWIIPLRTVYVVDDVVCGEPRLEVDGSGMDEVEYTFRSDEPFVKKYRWAWKT